MDNEIKNFRKRIEKAYADCNVTDYAGFDEILCYEMHSQTVNPRVGRGERGLTFKELAQKRGISVSFLGKLIADHCERLEE